MAEYNNWGMVEHLINQAGFSTSSLAQDGSTGKDWRQATVEASRWLVCEVTKLRTQLEERERYIGRLEKINDGLLRSGGFTSEEAE